MIPTLADDLMRTVRPYSSTDVIAKEKLRNQKLCIECNTKKHHEEFRITNPKSEIRNRRRSRVCVACESKHK